MIFRYWQVLHLSDVAPQDFLWGFGSKCGNIYRTDGKTKKNKIKGGAVIRLEGLYSKSKRERVLGTLEYGVGSALDSDAGSSSCHGYAGAS